MPRQLSLFAAGVTPDAITEQHIAPLLTDCSPLLWHAIHLPWQEFQLDRARDARFRDLSVGPAAWWLHTQIVRTAKKLTDDCPELELTCSPEWHQQFSLNLGNELVIVFKKLVRRWSRRLGRHVLERSNYLTKHNCDFWEQRRDAGFIDAPRIIIGYEPIREMTEIKIHVGYPRSRGRGFAWLYEMPNQMEAAARRFGAAVPPAHEQEIRRGFNFSDKENKSSDRGAV